MRELIKASYIADSIKQEVLWQEVTSICIELSAAVLLGIYKSVLWTGEISHIASVRENTFFLSIPIFVKWLLKHLFFAHVCCVFKK